MVNSVMSPPPPGMAAMGLPDAGEMVDLPADAPQLMGHPVSAVAALSVFADAMAELTASLSERTQEKKLRERKVGDGEQPIALKRGDIQTLLEGLASDPGDAAGAQARQASRVDLAAQVLKAPAFALYLVGAYTGGNPTEQYLLLRELDEMIAAGELDAREPDTGVREDGREALREAAADLLAEHAGQILADINTYSALSGLPPAQAQAVRSTYRDVVIGAPSLAQTLRSLVEAAGSDEAGDFLRVHQSLMQAIGLDLAAARPSTDKVRLQALASDMFQLTTISTALERCTSMVRTLAGRYTLEPPQPHRLAGELIAISGERWVDAARFTRLCERFGLDQPPACAIEFLQAARTLIAGLPVQVFNSGEARGSLMDSLQSALDTAIAREEGQAP